MLLLVALIFNRSTMIAAYAFLVAIILLPIGIEVPATTPVVAFVWSHVGSAIIGWLIFQFIGVFSILFSKKAEKIKLLAWLFEPTE